MLAKIDLGAEAFDLSEQLTQCLLKYEPVWENRCIEIETAIPDGIRIQADPELLELVWKISCHHLFSV